MSLFAVVLLRYPSARPAGVRREDEESRVVVAVGGNTGGVSEDQQTGVQTGNGLQFQGPSRYGSIRKTF